MPGNDWFAQHGVTENYHGGGNVVFDETDILEWLTGHQIAGKNSRMKVFLVNNRPYRESRIYAVPCAIFVKSDMLPPETYDGNCRLPKVRIKNK